MDYPGKVIRKTPVTPSQTSASGVWTLDDASAATKTNTWPVAGVPNPISRSLRFNSADSAYLNRTPGSTTNRRTWTWSGWIKLGTIANWGGLFNAGTSGDQFAIYLYTDSTLYIQDYASSANNIQIQPTQVFRDPSAWYHIVVAIDTTQATSSNRVKVYINGSQVTAFSTSTYPSQNYDTQVNSTSFAHNVGRNYQFATSTAKYFDGYMTEVNFIDGQALTPSSFGMTDPQTGAWIPIKYTGTYGTNGFYLNFKDNSSTSALGYDYSGNTNNWTTNNFSVTAGVGNDSLTDVPTPWIAYNTTGDVGGVVRGNYCTLNPLSTGAGTYTQGNLRYVSNANWRTSSGTIFVSTGKWYWEVTIANSPYTPRGSTTAWNAFGFGVLPTTVGTSGNPISSLTNVLTYGDNGYANNFGTISSDLGAVSSGDILSIAVDLDSNSYTLRKNNSQVATGTIGGTAGRALVPIVVSYSDTYGVMDCNFGQRPFAYTPPAGFVSLCTTNLPTPTIGATSTTQANDYFNTVLYTGTGSSLSVTGVGFQPDFVWIKSRSAATDHGLYDAVRGVQKQLESNTTTEETTETTGLTAFGTDGFTVGALAQLNTNTATYVGWNWKGNGAGSSNTSGTITSTVSASTTAGFSIVSYTGNATAGATVGHGLGVAPSMIFIKRRNGTAANTEQWIVYHASLGATYYLYLNATNAAGTPSPFFNNTAPTSTVFSLANDTAVNRNGDGHIAYCFAPVAGYSAFGSYTGNGSTDGVFIYTGFRPRYIMIKRTNTTGNWIIYDAARNPANLANNYLYANASDAAVTDTPGVDLLSNGFKNRNDYGDANFNGSTYVYAAFAEFPFKFANAR